MITNLDPSEKKFAPTYHAFLTSVPSVTGPVIVNFIVSIYVIN